MGLLQAPMSYNNMVNSSNDQSLRDDSGDSPVQRMTFGANQNLFDSMGNN
jgi:hypothetical protein